jgi:hypothetical protein
LVQQIFFVHYDLEWYKSLFLQTENHRASGEINPSYSILDSQDVAQLKKPNPDMKHIFMIRNPIERAWSAIRFGNRIGKMNVDLNSSQEVISALKSQHTVLRSDYERTLNVYLEHFDASQILICFYDAIQDDPIDLLSCITSFLNVNDFKEAEIDNQKRVNYTPQSPMPHDVRLYLLEKYNPLMDRLAKNFGSYSRIWNAEANSPDTGQSDQLDRTKNLPALRL